MLAELFVVCNKKCAVAISLSAFIAVGVGVLVEISLPPQFVASIVGLMIAALSYILLNHKKIIQKS